MDGEDFSVDELAEFLHLTPPQVLRLVSRDKLPGRKVSGEWRFPRAEIHHWLEAKIGVSDEAELKQVESVLQRRAGHQGDSTEFLDQIRADTIFLPLNARTKQSVVSQLCESCANVGLVWDPHRLADAIRQREDLHSTALENGVAMLHPRRPMPDNLAEPFLALGITSQGIPFGGPRGQLTDLFFLLASVDDASHLRTLARLSRVISNPTTIDLLRSADSVTAVIEVMHNADEELTK